MFPPWQLYILAKLSLRVKISAHDIYGSHRSDQNYLTVMHTLSGCACLFKNILVTVAIPRIQTYPGYLAIG